MNPPGSGTTSLSRRALLGGVAGLSASRLVPRAAGAASTLTVATRNLALGVDLSRLFRADSMADVRDIAGSMLRQIRSHPYQARMDAIAEEVADSRPHVLGLQEAATIRVQEDSDFAETTTPNASTTVVDLLELLASALDSRGLEYEVESSVVTTDVEVPADDDGGRTDVRLTDRVAVLVRSDVETGESRADTFDAALTYPLRGGSATIRRGYCLVDVVTESTTLAVATAHLESADAYTREQQAEALRDRLPTDRPVVLVGDLNSGPGGPTAAYDALTTSLDDAVATAQPDADAPTCCQPNDLRADDARFSRRVDHVLYRGDLRPTAVRRVGADRDSRVAAMVDGESRRLWPSDHAGVVATLAVSATATQTATSTSTPSTTATESTPDRDGDASLPLLGSAAGVGGLSLAGLVWYRWRR